jgi:nitrous oxide reductase accessory protein NosL
MTRTMLSALLLAGMMTHASSHGPWPAVCCSDRDCAEVDSKNIQEADGMVHIVIQPGSHPMWPADGRTAFIGSIRRAELRKPVTGEWGVCISPTGKLLCVFPPMTGV